MGRQVNFWMLYPDAEEFARFILGQANGFIIARLSRDREPRMLAVLPPVSERWWWASYIGNRDMPFTPRWIQVREGPDAGLYALDPSGDDPAVQFHASVLRESGGLSRGRIWTGCKEPTFLSWYEGLARWLRTRYARVRKVGGTWLYAGPEANKWHKEGGRLE
jgi:hypothetical protein